MQKIILSVLLIVTLFSCKKENQQCPSSTEKEFNLTGFSRISAGENFSLLIKQGATYGIKAKGCSADLDDLLLSVGQGNVLDVKYNGYRNNRYQVEFEITLPVIAAVNISGAARATLTGFGQQTSALRVVLAGASTCRLESLPLLVRADLSGTSKFDVVGTATDLIANLSGDGRLNSYTASFDDIDLSTSGTAKAYVQVQKSLAAFAAGDSRIYYKGTPASVNVEQSGTAKVIHE
jgi:hypothetical protein